MRLTLLFILLFSVLGGYSASASHTTVGSQAFHYSEKQQSSREIIRDLSLAWPIDPDTLTEIFAVDDNMEDDEDKDNLSFKKCKIPASATLASYHIITLGRLHGYRLPAAPVCSSSSCKYITQRNLRV